LLVATFVLQAETELTCGGGGGEEEEPSGQKWKNNGKQIQGAELKTENTVKHTNPGRRLLCSEIDLSRPVGSSASAKSVAADLQTGAKLQT